MLMNSFLLSIWTFSVFGEVIRTPGADSSEHGVAPGSKGTTCPCGKANKNSERIINGIKTGEHEYPFMVRLMNPDDGITNCGASIISRLHILTAAHCYSNPDTRGPPNPARYVAVVGSYSLTNDDFNGVTKAMKVKSVHIPKIWFERTYSGDIAVLVLQSPIKFNKWVSPVCLSPTPLPIVNKYVRLLGWGFTGNGRPDELEQADLIVQPRCYEDNKDLVCLEGSSASCKGDSGGPYVYVDPETNRYTQVALVSGGSCEDEESIGIDVVYYYNWIQGIIKATSNENPCIKAN